METVLLLNTSNYVEALCIFVVHLNRSSVSLYPFRLYGSVSFVGLSALNTFFVIIYSPLCQGNFYSLSRVFILMYIVSLCFLKVKMRFIAI